MERIYIAGKITGDPNYYEKFQRAKTVAGSNTVLDPTMLPSGLSQADYMRVCFAMIDTADRIMFLPDFMDSPGALLELSYCQYIKKPITILAEIPTETMPEPEPINDPTSSYVTAPKPESETKSSANCASEGIRPYTGFVFLRCPNCNKEHAFCTKTPMTEYTCRDCGHTFTLPPATVAYTECECGQRSRYITNMNDWCFDIPCVTCGAPCTVEYNPSKILYEPVGLRRMRKKKRHH